MTDVTPVLGAEFVAGDLHNVTDWCLEQFRNQYPALGVTKDDIWEYMYGVMHAPDWRDRYRHDLSRSLPRIPLAPDFETFRAAGRSLMDLHVGYETCPQQPGVVCVVDGEPDDGDADDDAYRITGRMRWGAGGGRSKDLTVLRVNDRCQLDNIPSEAHDYQVSGRSPLQWAVDQLKVKHDKASGIVDDPNRWHRWANDPFELIRHLRRLAHVGVTSTAIINDLPPSLT